MEVVIVLVSASMVASIKGTPVVSVVVPSVVVVVVGRNASGSLRA